MRRSIASAADGEREPSARTRELRPVILDYLATAWRQPDEGIWEVRGGPQHFVHSKVMAWAAFDRAANDAQEFGESAAQWRRIADEIHAEVCERGFDRELNSFVQAYGSKQLDASLLLIPLVGFLPPEDPRVRGTLRAWACAATVARGSAPAPCTRQVTMRGGSAKLALPATLTGPVRVVVVRRGR